VLDAPVDAVWMAINDHDGFQRDGNVALSLYLSGRERGSGQRTVERLDLPIIADRWWVQEVVHNGRLFEASEGRVWELFARAVDTPVPDTLMPLVGDGVRITWSQGGWFLVPVDRERTLAEYWVWSDPGGAVPAGLASRFAAGAIRGLFDDVEVRAQDLAESQPRGFVRPDQSRF
jgi:hypothetical protein